MGKNSPVWILLLVFMFLLSACEQRQQFTEPVKPETISSEDECHVCGMQIQRFPGPKGQAILRHGSHPIKFCSTTELFGWLLQPDTPGILHSAYVHDMGKALSWEKPDDQYYVEVTHAWYVIGHSKQGAMGNTLASFSTEMDAKKFQKQFGGKVINYGDINMSLITGAMQQ